MASRFQGRDAERNVVGIEHLRMRSTETAILSGLTTHRDLQRTE